MSIFEDLVAVGLDAADEFAGQDATYTRGQTTLPIRVIPSSAASMDTGGDAVSQIKVFNFLVKPSELKIGGVAIVPQRGDQVIWKEQIYSVLPGTGASSFTESDTHEFLIEIHTTKKIDVESE